MPKPNSGPRVSKDPLDLFAAAAASKPSRKRVLFEGDSWMAYPGGNLITVITHDYSCTPLNLSTNGDELVEMVSGSQRNVLRKALKRFDFAVIVISGGGNDIVGLDLFPLLRDYKASYAPADCIDDVALGRRLQMLGLAFWEIATLRNYYDPAAVLVTHTYDYAIPDGRGVDFIIKNIAGPWLKPSMDERGINPDLAFRSDIVRLLIDRYAAMVLALTNEISNFKVVDSRGTLGGAAQWANELHPTKKGFEKVVAERWSVVLDPLLNA